jgi:hypothetical protein
LDNCGNMIPGRNQVGINSCEELIPPCVSKFWSPWGSREKTG